MYLPCCICIALFASFALTAHPAWSQNAPAPQGLANAGPAITLDVVVAGKNGKPVSGLQQQDFTLLDNKRPTPISSFLAVPAAGKPNPPVEAIILIDTINTDYATLSIARTQLQSFLSQNGGHLPLPVSLVILSYSGLQWQQEASSDGNVELAFLNKNEFSLHTNNRAQGERGDYDRIDFSLSALRAVTTSALTMPGRKLLIWLSPGWPVPPDPLIGLGPKEKEQVFNRIVASSGLLMMSRTTLYSVDPLGTSDAGGFNTTAYREYLNDVKVAAQARMGNTALQVFVTESGGRVLIGSNNLVAELNACLQDADNYYSLTFTPARADHPNEYHHLEVKVDKPGLKARTRTSYYLQP